MMRDPSPRTAATADTTDATAGDPRLSRIPDHDDVRPVVARSRGGPSGLVLGIGIAVVAILLFVVLNARRQASEAPAVRVVDRTVATVPATPSLYVPPAPAPPVLSALPTPGPRVVPTTPFVLPQPPVGPRIVYVPQPGPPAPAYYPPPVLPQPPMGAQQTERSGSPVLVVDLSGPQGGDAAGSAGSSGDGNVPVRTGGPVSLGSPAATARASAGILANRGTTVAQGTLIPAVLETALDSTRPGFARAIVSRDVRGFDGTRILIPRGSRVFGDYVANAAAGQNRAMINWTRLVRPDGVTIAIGSPASDTLGRGGVRARVNSHFFARFGSALLQSALQVGVNLASRPADGSVVLALPGQGGFGGGGLLGNQNAQPVPTLTIRPGTSITIFAARDLDFTGFGSAR